MITIYTADQGIVKIMNHCLLRHRKNGGILGSQLCFSLRMLVKYRVTAVFAQNKSALSRGPEYAHSSFQNGKLLYRSIDRGLWFATHDFENGNTPLYKTG